MVKDMPLNPAPLSLGQWVAFFRHILLFFKSGLAPRRGGGNQLVLVG
jgi:hypothetical protein